MGSHRLRPLLVHCFVAFEGYRSQSAVGDQEEQLGGQFVVRVAPFSFSDFQSCQAAGADSGVAVAWGAGS